MLHASVLGRLFLIPPNLHLPKLVYPSIFSHWFSIAHHHQTQVHSAQAFNIHNELLHFFDHLIRQCCTIHQPKQIHSQVILTGAARSAFLASRLVSVYAWCGLLKDARKVFETSPVQCLSNLLLWNSILRANVTYAEYEVALRLYLRMRKLRVCTDGFTFPLIIKACAMLGDARLCKNVHCHVLQMGFQNNLHVANELLGMYGKIGRMDEACQLFDRMVARSHISWNIMLSGFSLNYDCEGAFEMFCRMEMEGWEPNPVTWTSLLSSHAKCGLCERTLSLFGDMRQRGVWATAETLAVVISVCCDLSMFDKGMVLHGYVTRGGFENYSFVKNSLICMYGKHGAAKEAETLFSELELKNIVSWNALISSYAESGLCDEAFTKFLQLEKLVGCAVERPNVVSWTAVISGFASRGRCHESLELFRQMQHANVMANPVTISSVLSACAELSALHLGREIHTHVTRRLMDRNILVGNGLINMYMKCGSLKEGQFAFANTDGWDLFSWNMMIAGYGMHGLGEGALELFNEMIKSGYKPDGITFVAVLSACSHTGLVSKGRKLFDQMTKEFGIEPLMEHYACMVDLLGRAGFLREASDIVKSMPMEPNASIWGALLNSCRVYKNTDIAEEIACQIFSLNSEMTGSYMLMSNIYAAGGRWKDSARVRLSARVRGLKKIPGQSWIEVNRKVHMFSAGNMVQRGMDEVYRIHENLRVQVEMEIYVHGRRFVLQNVDEEDSSC